MVVGQTGRQFKRETGWMVDRQTGISVAADVLGRQTYILLGWDGMGCFWMGSEERQPVSILG